MRAFLGEKSNQAQARLPLLDLVDGATECLIARERAVFYREIEASVVLQDDAPGADVHVPGLRIARSARFQADGIAILNPTDGVTLHIGKDYRVERIIGLAPEFNSRTALASAVPPMHEEVS